MKLFSQHIDYHTEIFQNKSGLPYLIMLHGFMGSGRVFDHLINSLKSFCNPVVIDLAGHGQTGGSLDPERYRTEKQVADLLSVFSRLQLSPMVLYGYSMGGRLALHFALKYSKMIDGLILESATAGIDDANLRSKRRKEDHQRAEQIKSDYPGFLNQWLQKPLFTGGSSRKDSQKTYRAVMKKQNPRYLVASLKGFGSGSMEPSWHLLKSLAEPVLLVAGERDKKFVTLNRLMHGKLPRSNFTIVKGAAHRVHLDRPEELIHHIEIFIKNNLLKE